MRHIGADLHKDQVTLVAENDQGDVLLKTRIPCKCVNQIRTFFEEIDPPFQIAVEAVGFYHWFCDLAEPYAERVLGSVRRPRTDAKYETERSAGTRILFLNAV